MKYRVGKRERYDGDVFHPIEKRGLRITGRRVWFPVAHTRNDDGGRQAKLIVDLLNKHEEENL